MIYISHRGNIDGPIPRHENTPGYIEDAINRGFDVEIDVWGSKGDLWLGHDRPTETVSLHYLRGLANRLWIHCKNGDALAKIQARVLEARYFFHHTDDYTMVSNGIIWCYPGKLPQGPHSIVVLPETWMSQESIAKYCSYHGVFGVCSDFVGKIKA